MSVFYIVLYGGPSKSFLEAFFLCLHLNTAPPFSWCQPFSVCRVFEWLTRALGAVIWPAAVNFFSKCQLRLHSHNRSTMKYLQIIESCAIEQNSLALLEFLSFTGNAAKEV